MTGQPLPDDPGPPMATSHTSPGDSSPPAPVPSYSEKLKVNVVRSERLKRNVLEIQIIADNGSDTNVDKETVAKLLAKLGIDWKTNMQGYQLSWKRIYVWFKESFDIKRFCYVDSIKVADGIKTGEIKPMDRREVDVKISGLNFNTPDSLVKEYLNKHGLVVSTKVIYETDKEGPFEGLHNGDRRYLVDFTNGRNMGSFHLLDGARI